jgi:O-acetylhomoserine/O-acetylserine sulfhydrylase-like pyridoxal-dependent enzyme
MPRSSEDNAWIQFLLASDNSIMRDAGQTLAVLTGNPIGEEIETVPLEQRNSRDWEQALLLAECLKFSENDDLVETARILFEWFSANFHADLII